MKVLILTESSQDIGFGHLTRCIALYQAFCDKGVMAELIVNADNISLDLLKNKQHRIFNWLAAGAELFEIAANSDFVVIDSYLAEKSLYDRISAITGGRMLIIDDYNRIAYPASIVVNPSIYGSQLNYPHSDKVVYLLGKDYIILRKEFWDVPEKRINEEVKTILLAFGGTDRSDLVDKIVSHLKNKFNFNFCIVEPKEHRLTASQMLGLMLEADICICGGGQTTYELVKVGVPMIGICFADNQLGNLGGWRRTGLLEYIGWYNDRNLLHNLELAVERFSAARERIRVSKSARGFLDGAGAKRVVQEALSIHANRN